MSEGPYSGGYQSVTADIAYERIPEPKNNNNDANTNARQSLLSQGPPNFVPNQDVDFENEEVIKSWSKSVEESYNHLVLTSHRVIFETKRIFGKNYFELSSSTSYGMLNALLQLLIVIANLLIMLFTIGTEPDNIIHDTNILLKDVITIHLIKVRFSELANHVKALILITLISGIFIVIPVSILQVIGIIISFLTVFSCVIIGTKLGFWLSDFSQNKTKQIVFIMTSGIFVFWIVYWSCAIAYTVWPHGGDGKLWAAGIFALITLLTEGVLLRLVYNDKVAKGLIQITSRRGVNILALDVEDIKEAKQLVWKTRKDIKKIVE